MFVCLLQNIGCTVRQTVNCFRHLWACQTQIEKIKEREREKVLKLNSFTDVKEATSMWGHMRMINLSLGATVSLAFIDFSRCAKINR